jgi:hypothetical protein
MFIPKNVTRHIRLAGLTLTVIFVLSSVLWAGEDASKKALDVIGTSIVIKNNVSQARDKAIANSLVSAVGYTVSDLMPRAYLIEKFDNINEMIYENAEQYILNYKVQAELVLKNKYRVMVQATVSIDKLKEQLERIGLGTSETLFPKILFLVTEKMCSDAYPFFWWGNNFKPAESRSESILSGIMKENGFPVADHTTGHKDGSLLTIKQANLSPQEALSLGLWFKADVVILGTATADKTLNLLGEDVKSFQGTVSVQAIRTDSGKQIADITKTATTVNADISQGCSDALEAACRLAGNGLSQKIKDAWEKGIINQKGIDVTVEGTNHLANFVMFRKELRNIPGVIDVQIRNMQSNSALMFVTFDGNANALAKALMLKTFTQFGIKIHDVSDNYLKVGLIPENPLN